MTIIPRMLLAAFVSAFVVLPTVLAAWFAVHVADFIQIDFLDARALSSLRRSFMDGLGVAIIGVAVAWAANLMIGFPAYVFLRILDLAQPVPCALIGATVGLVAGHTLSPEPEWYVALMACGGSVAAMFCRVASGRPEPDFVEEPGVWY